MSITDGTSSPLRKKQKLDNEAKNLLPELTSSLIYKFDDYPGHGSGIEIYEKVKTNLKYMSFTDTGHPLKDENGEFKMRNRLVFDFFLKISKF
mgnify:CR=1 FL=1